MAEEKQLKKILPHSSEAEKNVIGSMFLDKGAIMQVSNRLVPEDFYYKQYSLMFQVMVELFNEDIPVEPIIVAERLRKYGVSDTVANTGVFAELIAVVETSVNVEYYANIVAEMATVRRLIGICEHLAQKGYSREGDVADLLEESQREIFDLATKRGENDYEPIKDIVIRTVERIEQMSHTRGDVTGIPTGFADLDYMLSGLQRSDLVLVAARPSMGKTAFVLNVAQHVLAKTDETVAIFSLEMSKDQLTNRLLSMESHVDAQKLRTGHMDADEWRRLASGAEALADSRLILDDTPGITINELRSKCRKFKLEKNLSLIIIDYLQLMSGGGKNQPRQQEISEISRSLKAIGRELNVPVIALSQLSRAVEQREDHRPMLSDLRESGAIEQDADVVMFLYRDDYYHKDTDHPNEAEVIIAKQRNGPVGTVYLAWLPEYTQFANLERRKFDGE